METTIDDLIKNVGLYQEITMCKYENLELLNFFLSDIRNTIDMHCIYCNKMSTFNLFNKESNQNTFFTSAFADFDIASFVSENLNNPNGYALSYSCSRNADHKYAFIFKFTASFDDSRVVKIGQFPSMADLFDHDIKKYRKLLEGDYDNLKKAIMLKSHGYGVGSYVYLRRVFENLIEEKIKELSTGQEDTEKIPGNASMDKKIDEVKHLLPPFLLEAPNLYKILSKGVHQLSEEQCKEYFDITKEAIMIILDEKIKMREEQKHKDEIIKGLNKIHVNTTN